MKIDLIATDMDGTLLNKEHKVSLKNKEAIIKAQKKGVKFVLASGRPTYAMLDFIKELEMDKYEGYLLSYNGAQIIDAKNMEIMYTNGLTDNEIRLIYEKAKEYNTAMITYIDDVIYIYNYNKYCQVEIDGTKMKYKLIDNLDGLDLSKMVKCMLVDDPKYIIELEEKMKEQFSDLFYIVRSQPIFLEIINKDVDKGKTLSKLIELLNLDKEKTIGVGDNYNDLALLNSVGIPVAVENAMEELKSIAKYISSDNNNDALFDIIEKYVEE